VSIKVVEQLGSEHEARIVFLTFPAAGHAIQAAIAELRSLASVHEVGQVLRVFR
jgi:homoserine dehydrogenase